MAKTLTSKINSIITNHDVGIKFRLYISDVNQSTALSSWNISFNKEFGAAQATFVLENNDGRFGESGANIINVGDIVDFREYFSGDTTEFKKFYGIVQQRSISKSATDRSITLVCLDYISTLEFLDINLTVEGTKIAVYNEVLTPNYLTGSTVLAQVFDFANENIANNPLPIIIIKDQDTNAEDPQYDGFEILYDNGQLKLGTPIEAYNNYSVIANYSYYVKGVYVEDILEDILTEVDGYGNYMFGESSAANVITNHFTDTFLNVEGRITDTMTPNYTPSDIIVETTLTADYDPDDSSPTILYVTDTTGFPNSGEASINGDIFTWASKTATTLNGISTTGDYALNAHGSGSYVKYTYTYSIGQVWYLSYSNVQTNLTESDFTITGGTFKYFDNRFGRIILTDAISTAALVTCDVDYTFKTLQASGIEINYISFSSREVENRFEAVQKLRNYVAPNYIIRTMGDNKIWASYLSQKYATEDYTLELATNLIYLEDEDLYTRAIFYGKNKNPTNLLLANNCSFIGSGLSYKAYASQADLSLINTDGNYYVYGCILSAGASSQGATTGDRTITLEPQVGEVDSTSTNSTKWPLSPLLENFTNTSNLLRFNQNKITIDDANCYTEFSTTSGSRYLRLSQFRFGLPDDAVIRGIIVSITQTATGTSNLNTIKWDTIQLLIGGAPSGNNKATETNWTSTKTIKFYGAVNDTWGCSLTGAQVNADNFGVILGIKATIFSILGTAKAIIDRVSMTIVYTSNALTTPIAGSQIGSIIGNTVTPIVYINGVPIDDASHQIVAQQIVVEITQTTTVSGGK